MSGGMRSGGAGSVKRRGVGWRGVRSCGVGQAAWGRAGGVDARGVGRLGLRGSVGLLGPGDESLIH
jgi:hypothetical protein